MNHMKDCFFIQNVGLNPEKGEVFGYNSSNDHFTKAKWDITDSGK